MESLLGNKSVPLVRESPCLENPFRSSLCTRKITRSCVQHLQREIVNTLRAQSFMSEHAAVMGLNPKP